MLSTIINIFSWIKLIVKLIIYLTILPFWLIYALVKYLRFKHNFRKQLKLSGLDDKAIKHLANELNFTSPFKEFL